MKSVNKSREEGPQDTVPPHGQQAIDRLHQDDVSPETQAQGEASSKSHTGSNASNNRLLKGLRSKTTWLRLLFTILFLAIWAVSRLIFATVVTLQVGFLLLGGAANARLATFGQGLAAYSGQLVAYLTFATDDKPFPLGDWPVPKTTQLDSGRGESSGTDDDSDEDLPDPHQFDSGPSAPKHGESAATDTDASGDTASSQDIDNSEKPAVGNGPAGTRRNKEPRQIGGRRTTQGRSATQWQRQPTISLPEVVCRRDHALSHWMAMLSVDERTQIQDVQQNEESLNEESGCYRLPSFSDQLTVIYANGHKINVALFEDKPLIFKLSRHWKGIGRKVSGITSGHYIVIAPEHWERTGHVPVAPDGCSDSRFMAHYFYRDDSSSSEIGGFRQFEFSLLKSGYELIGKRVFDDSEDGELFVSAVPTLRTSQQVSHARTGSEDENGWRGENFRPDEQALSEILNNRQGHFFVRVYDENVELLDSGEFRYLRDLNEIRIDGKPYTKNTILLPPSSGYVPATVRLVGANGAIIRPILPPELNHVTMQGTELIVNPHPDGSKIVCTLRSESGCVNIVIDLPFVWWRMERDGDGPDEWRDKPLVMSRQEFRDHAYGETAVRLRLNPRIKAVHVGFDDESSQSYRRDANNGDLLIPLVDFVDYSQIDKRLTIDASLTVACDRTTFTLIRVSADPIPEIVTFTSRPAQVCTGEQTTLSWKTRHAEADGLKIEIEPGIGKIEPCGNISVTMKETTTYALRLKTPGMDEVTKSITVQVRAHEQLEADDLVALNLHANSIVNFTDFMELPNETPLFLQRRAMTVVGKTGNPCHETNQFGRWIHAQEGWNIEHRIKFRVDLRYWISEGNFESYRIVTKP